MFHFDNVFGKEAGTDTVFNKVGRKIVDGVMKGINGTIFAYGQTSSGKTFTMQGCEESPGIVALAAECIFNSIKQHADRDFVVRVSYIEVYNEKINDLLNPSEDGDATGKDMVIEKNDVNAEYHLITCASDVMESLLFGEKYRHVGSTDMNEHSSRSHTIFRITVESKIRGAKIGLSDGRALLATLNLVDLAGSENAR